MRLLLDTQIELWAVTDSHRLPTAARHMILDPANEVFFSAATIWEIAIKPALARGDIPVSGADARQLFLDSGYRELPISSAHAAANEDLPPIHADPFDRILVAQAATEPLKLLTADRLLPPYGDMVQPV